MDNKLRKEKSGKMIVFLGLVYKGKKEENNG